MCGGAGMKAMTCSSLPYICVAGSASSHSSGLTKPERKTLPLIGSSSLLKNAYRREEQRIAIPDWRSVTCRFRLIPNRRRSHGHPTSGYPTAVEQLGQRERGSALSEACAQGRVENPGLWKLIRTCHHGRQAS